MILAQLALHKYMPHPVLATQATNALYAELEDNAQRRFAEIFMKACQAFYYLPVRKNKDVEREIGRNFAMLCDKDDYEPYIALGRQAFAAVDAYASTTVWRPCASRRDVTKLI